MPKEVRVAAEDELSRTYRDILAPVIHEKLVE